MNPANINYQRVALELGKERKKAFVIKCTMEGRSMTDIIQELVDEYLARKNRKRACGPSQLYHARKAVQEPYL